MNLPDAKTLFLIALLGVAVTVSAQDHDGHGEWIPASERELFYRSPFHRAELHEGLSEVDVPITTESKKAQAFFNQGMSMLYSGWIQEAERSFYTAHLEDEAAPMPRWGVALTHLLRDPTRATAWISGLENKEMRSGKLSLLELALLNSLPPHDRLTETNSWREVMVQRLREEVRKHPKLTELKAVLAGALTDAWHPWLSDVGETRDGLLKLIDEVTAANPQHPAARLGLRLWANELRHDPYHTKKQYFDLKRVRFSSAYPAHWNLVSRYLAEREQLPAALQCSEITSRIHHQWSARERRMPDLLPEYARHRAVQAGQFQTVGNAAAAIAIAQDMLRLPRHPRWNSATNSFGSFFAGRQALLESYQFFGLWDELANALRDGTIPPLVSPIRRAEHAYAEAIAAYFRKDGGAFDRAAARLKKIADSVRSDFLGGRIDVPDAGADPHHDDMRQWLREGGEDYLAVTEWNRSLLALRHFRQSDEVDTADMVAGSRRIHPLLRARLLWSMKHFREARQALLNTASLPLSMRIQATRASEEEGEFPLRFPLDRKQLPRIHQVPVLNSMGMTRWEPLKLPEFSLPMLDGSRLDNQSLRGRHTVLIVVYSSTCSHCVEQLEELRRLGQKFAAADLDVRVIAGQSAKSLASWLKSQADFPARFAADPDERVFRCLGAYDDFNDMPLHATIYVEPGGRMLWKDIGYEPFMDLGFFVEETKRLRRFYSESLSE